MKHALTLAVAALAFTSANALADTTTIISDSHAPATLSSCDVSIDSASGDNEQLGISVDVRGFDAHDVMTEVTLQYDTGRSISTLIPYQSLPLSKAPVTVPRLAGNVTGIRCAIATASNDNGLYIAPWLPTSATLRYSLARSFDLPPVPDHL